MQSVSGFIKDYRSELDSDIWLMPPLYHRVWQYLKYKVNHAEADIPMRDGSFMKIIPGQHLTSVRGIAQGVGYYEGTKWKEPNPKTISSILAWLEKQNMIKIERGQGNRQYTLITLLNWDLYQSEKSQGNSKETARKQLADINKKNKEEYKNNNTRHKYSEDTIYFQLANFFYQQILKNNPEHKEPNFQKWSDDIRKMMELDKRTEEQVRYLMQWVQNDSFEMANVLSPSKLRKRFDQLVIKVKAQKQKVIPINKGRDVPKKLELDITAGEDW